VRRRQVVTLVVVVACLLAIVVLVPPRWSATKSPNQTATFSGFVTVSEADFRAIYDKEGFADGIAVDPARKHVVVAEISVKLESKSDVGPFEWKVDAPSKSFLVKVTNSAGWAGIPHVRAFTDGNSIGMIFDGCGEGLVNKYDKKGALLLSLKIEGHVHPTGCLAPAKGLLCVTNGGPVPDTPSRSQVHIFNWVTGEEVTTLTLPSTTGSIRPLAISRDEQFLFVGIPSRDKIYRLDLPRKSP
jgi:hypothetical protein